MMVKLRVIWDPKGGLAFPDGIVPDFIEALLRQTCEEHTVRVGCESLVNGIRLAIAQGRIPAENVLFIVSGDEIQPNANGVLPRWPVGFCDLITKQCTAIIRLAASKEKQNA